MIQLTYAKTSGNNLRAAGFVRRPASPKLQRGESLGEGGGRLLKIYLINYDKTSNHYLWSSWRWQRNAG